MLGAIVAGAFAVRAADDAGLDVLPPCPFHAATGLDCPGCGVTRAVIALTRGDLVGAADHNLLLVVALPVLLAVWVVARRRRRADAGAAGRAPSTPPPWALSGFIAVALVFGVVRNLPGVPFLDAA